MRQLILSLSLIFLLSGCLNRFETYEPYSAFDDRMHDAEKNMSMYPENSQSPYGDGDQYGYYTDDRYAYPDYQFDRQQPSRSAPRRVQNYSNGNPNGDTEVPFSDSRGPAEKHPVNVGAL